MGKFNEIYNPKVEVRLKGEKEIQYPLGLEESGRSKEYNSSIKNISDEQLNELKLKKAWEIAFAPAKSIPMNLIMSYMTGNSLQMIPIMMTLMLLWNPIKAIFTDTNKLFENLQTKSNFNNILLTKICFISSQLLSMSVGVWKLYKMGLIPHSEADWLAWKQVIEFKESIILI